MLMIKDDRVHCPVFSLENVENNVSNNNNDNNLLLSAKKNNDNFVYIYLVVCGDRFLL